MNLTLSPANCRKSGPSGSGRPRSATSRAARAIAVAPDWNSSATLAGGSIPERDSSAIARSIPSSTSGSGGRSLTAASPRSGWIARNTCWSASCASGFTQGLRGAVEGARDRRPLAGHERPRPGVEANRLCRADLGRRPTGKLLELLGQRFGLRGVGVGPTRRAAHEDLQIVHAPHRKLLGLGIPPAAALAHGPRQRLEPRGGTRDRRLIGHERTAAQRAREAHQLVGAGTVALGEQRVEALEILPRLEGEEVRHAERLGGFGHGA